MVAVYKTLYICNICFVWSSITIAKLNIKNNFQNIHFNEKEEKKNHMHITATKHCIDNRDFMFVEKKNNKKKKTATSSIP